MQLRDGGSFERPDLIASAVRGAHERLALVLEAKLPRGLGVAPLAKAEDLLEPTHPGE